MAEFKRAQSLQEVAWQAEVEPLEPGDPRYVDIRTGRGSANLKKMRLHLRDQDASKNRFAKIALIGHRGTGKTTELYKLEKEMSDSFTPLHLFVDDDLLQTLDYSDLLLWLVESLARRFAEDTSLMPLSKGLVDDVARWFAERTLDDVKKTEKEIELTTEAETKAKVNFYWLGLGLLARIKSTIKGDVERRETIHSRLRQYGSELIQKVNLLLGEASGVLQKCVNSPDLLIVQDNLDRLPPEVARRLFFDNGDFLKQLQVHTIYTVPIALILAPCNISMVFPNSFFMPTLEPRSIEDQEIPEAVDALVKVIEGRVEIEKVFSDREVARELARKSGGSMRDLIRLLNYAQLAARAADKSVIDDEAAQDAIRDLRLDYERLLIPSQVYYPILAGIHQSKTDQLPSGVSSNPKDVENARAFLRDLLFNGSVMEYNGEQSWYDVHPVIRDIQAFKNAYQQLREQPKPPAGAPSAQ
ncbi:MAG: hypothetical protein NTX50_10300 [Candidatus Sumerlaeota bacterium]|nr:hypothetical protein [Candidatus Sumerlaeota bacterium]